MVAKNCPRQLEASSFLFTAGNVHQLKVRHYTGMVIKRNLKEFANSKKKVKKGPPTQWE